MRLLAIFKTTETIGAMSTCDLGPGSSLEQSLKRSALAMEPLGDVLVVGGGALDLFLNCLSGGGWVGSALVVELLRRRKAMAQASLLHARSWVWVAW